MERLMNVTLTESDKEKLRLKSRDGVCVTPNGHECYLGLALFTWNFDFVEKFTLGCSTLVIFWAKMHFFLNLQFLSFFWYYEVKYIDFEKKN